MKNSKPRSGKPGRSFPRFAAAGAVRATGSTPPRSRGGKRGPDAAEDEAATGKPAYANGGFRKSSRPQSRPQTRTAEKGENWNSDSRKVEPRKFGPRKFDARKADDVKPNPRRSDPRKSDAYKSDKRKTGDRPAPRGEDVRQGRDTVLIWGLHAARAAWLNPKRRIHRIWLTDAGQALFAATQAEALEALLKRPDAKIQERADLDRITPPGSVHQGIVIETFPVAEPSLHDIINADPPPDLMLMLDQVTDPHNVGAILRSAAAFGAGAIIMTERNAPTTTGVLAKSASGALEHTPMVHVVNLARALEDLRNAGYWCVGLAEEGEKNLGDLDMSGRTVLVLGAEGEGLRHLTRQKCDELARLPTGGAIGSLNVSNAAAVALYEVRRQAKKAP